MALKAGLSAVTLASVAILALPSPTGANRASETLRLKGIELAYNLDHDAAMQLLEEAVAADPADPAAHRTLAGVLWLHLLFRRGAVTVDNYLGRVTRPSVPVEKPPPDLDARFRHHVRRALELAEARVRAAPADPDGHFELGAAAWFAASYTASIEGQLLAGFRAARRAYNAHEKVLALDPRRKDAAFVVGAYRYVVSTLSWPMRVVAYVAGFGGGREEGIRLVEEAAAHPGDLQTQAQFILVLLYNRERRYADALRVLEALERQYPRNRLLWLEQGSTALRAGNLERADTALTHGLTMLATDRRPRMFGEEALWRYKRGATRLLLGRLEEAAEDLTAALSLEAHDWVRGRIQLELGKLADLRDDRSRARDYYRRALVLCRASRDGRCVEEATQLADRGYAK